jgi:hypothetical protein
MIRHRFFGSQAIVDNLKTALSWDDDYVTVYGSQLGPDKRIAGLLFEPKPEGYLSVQELRERGEEPP